MIVKIYTGISSKAPKLTKKLYGYILECELSGQIWTKEGFGEIEGSYNQAELAALKEAIQRVKPGNDLIIYSENEFVMNSMKKNLQQWAMSDFKKASGSSVANAELWREIWRGISARNVSVVPGKHEYTEWIAGELKKVGE